MWTPSTTALAAAAALAMADPCVGFVPGAGMLKLGRPSINSNVASTRRAHTESRGILGARMQEVKLKDVWNRNAGFEVMASIKHEDIEAMFNKFDKDGNGQICDMDLAAALKEKGVAMTDYEFMIFLQEVDTNVDGLVCVQDFEKAVAKFKVKTGRVMPSGLEGTQTVIAQKAKPFFEKISEETDTWREGQRRYRRTVFGPKDWIRYRRSTRLLDNLFSTFNSAVINALWFDIGITMTVATSVLLWNHALDDGIIKSALQPLAGMKPEDFDSLWKGIPRAVLPLSPFTLSSPSLGLLLVFRTNGAFQRFFEARALWGGVVNYSRNFVRQAVMHLEPAQAEELGRRIIAFPYALKMHLRYDEDVDSRRVKELEKILGPKQAAKLLSAGHRPCQAITDLTSCIRHSNASPLAMQQFDRSLEAFSNQLGACERIFKTPLPLLYTKHTARFLTIWCFMLPFALYKDLGGNPILIPISATITAFLLGIEELGVQITEPFSVLPLENMCGGIEASCTQMLRRGIPETADGWEGRYCADESKIDIISPELRNK